ncbi:N-acetylmannosamine-6-phosphate 2-epimerase [Vibrio ishigakensis]|uniref:N-acetylmannosamine-6-phosphate 2-epimerase n=1 Tax=Vibrio ishigakensis TaxID=1481914 RepID=UPI0021C4A7E8|nr:N-acetylmannosamine-6-phosphate 2-epimerase [Vibrio ishigakensis]
MSSTKKDIIPRGLIVSCQTVEGDPIHNGSETVVTMAKAAEWGGATGIRADKPEQIKAIKQVTDLPVIGLWKVWKEGTDVFITPSMKEVRAIIEAGADIVAVDCTQQLTAEGRPAYEIIPEIKAEFPDAIIFADVATVDEAKNAVEMGVDIVAPTLYGYTKYTIAPNVTDPSWEQPPSFQLLADIARECGDKCVVMMEGHINTPEEAVQCMYLGAEAVVVGSAITRPHLITKRFNQRINKYQ